jgi:hypothetical protein
MVNEDIADGAYGSTDVGDGIGAGVDAIGVTTMG